MTTPNVPTTTILGTLRRSAAAWRPHWRLGLLILVTLLVQQLFQTFFAYCLKVIVDMVQKGADYPRLMLILAQLGLGFMLVVIASLGDEKLEARAPGLLMGDMRRQLYDKLLGMSVDFYVRNRLGDILARFVSDLAVIQTAFMQATFATVLTVLGLIINVPVMLSLDWRLTLLALILLPLILVVNQRFVPRASEATYQLKQSEGALVNTVQESVRAQLIVKAFGLQANMSEQFAREVDNLGAITERSRFAVALVGKGSGLLIQLIQIIVIIAGALLALRGELSAGSLVAFITILGAICKDTDIFAKKVVPSLIEAGSGLRRVDEILQATPSVVDGPTALPLPRLKEQIRFEGVDFSYTGDQLHLNQLDLTVHQGQTVAFVGPSGSGKSTVLGLLQRFYEPTAGRILFDGHAIGSATQDSLRSQMGVVFQENFLFNTSIRENIRLARPNATDAEVEAAAQSAEIHDLIMSLPQGYDAGVGEAGGRLSGGQRQRIAIARAILRDPAILVLDEATSALDPGTEAAINQTIARLGRGRTVISVTHRLASVVDADQIHVMQNGRLVESGSHDSLLAAGGLYADLWEKQAGFEVSADGRQATIGPERLQRMHLFAALSLAQLAAVAEQFSSSHYNAGEIIFEQGDVGDRFYMIVRGRVEVVAKDKADVEHHLENLEDGDHFGEMALLQDQPRNATIRTLTPCLVITLGRTAFTRLVEQFPEMKPAINERIARSAANLIALSHSSNRPITHAQGESR